MSSALILIDRQGEMEVFERLTMEPLGFYRRQTDGFYAWKSNGARAFREPHILRAIENELDQLNLTYIDSWQEHGFHYLADLFEKGVLERLAP